MFQSKYSKILVIFSTILIVVRSFPQEAPAPPLAPAPLAAAPPQPAALAPPAAPAPLAALAPAEPDLKESADEAIGDRIMEEMNGMKVRIDFLILFVFLVELFWL